jgi:hypothetical protein
MKTLLSALVLAGLTTGYAQSISFDFESATAGMQGYDGATFTVVPNPSSAGNPSANAAKIVKVNAGDLWAGGKLTGLPALNFSAAATSVLSMKVFTQEPVGTVIKVKLESPYTGEVDAVTTVSGAWETLLFDFGIPACTGSADLVLMPQPFTAGGGKTFYFDDIQQVAGTIATPLAGLPLTFETGATADHFFSFESAQLSVVPNPQVNTGNPSATVAKLVRHLGAPFGGSKITFAQPIDFTADSEISMKVWTSAPVGTPVTLKAEKPFWGVERSVQTTQSGQWETLTFDFAGALNDMPTLAFLFDFVAGSTQVGNGSAQSTFYFDDVRFASTLASEELRGGSITVRPNPTAHRWTVDGSFGAEWDVQLFDLHGTLLAEYHSPDGSPLEVDATAFPSGMYWARLAGQGEIQTVKLVKQ